LFLQLAYSKQITFSREEILAGQPRKLALGLEGPLSFALEKALRRHVAHRTASAMELWGDLNSPSAEEREPPEAKQESLPVQPTEAEAETEGEAKE
jgi:hypothetical protein